VTSAVHSLPPAQLAPLLDAYARTVAAKRQRFILGLAILLGWIVLSGWVAEVDPATLFGKIGNLTSYVDRLFILESGARVWTDPQEWFWGLKAWSRLLGETLLIAYVGTATGAAGAFLLCFLSARNLARSRLLRAATQRYLEFCRTVPEIVFALIFVVAFGLGPVPGVLAIAIHTLGALGKLFAEVVENIDLNPVEGVAATGSTWIEQVRFAVVPQVLSNFASYALLRFEINVRGAAVMGFVGAGGIGQDLITAIRKFYYSDVSALLLLIIATVMVIDLMTERLRHWLLGLETRP
jgi:phosphonate transport system permease protein